jgi:hypothetical protein
VNIFWQLAQRNNSSLMITGKLLNAIVRIGRSVGLTQRSKSSVQIVGIIVDYSHITPETASCADRDYKQIVFMRMI